MTIRGHCSIPDECEWWVRRPDTALPLALIFEAPWEKIVLPADAFTVGIFALSVTEYRYIPIILDIERNLEALTELRNFSVNGDSGDTSDVTNLNRLATLASLKLLHALHLDGEGGLVAWPAECQRLRYVFLKYLSRGTGLQSVAACRGLRSLYLHQCFEIADLSPLGNSTSLECLYIEGGDPITNYEHLRGMTNLRTLRVHGEAFNSWELLCDCPSLEWLRVAGEAGISSMDDLADVAPYLRHLELRHDHLIQTFNGVNLHLLTSLRIDDGDVLRAVDVYALKGLVKVSIANCNALESVCIGSGVRVVTVCSCHALSSLDRSGVTSLEELGSDN